VATPVHGQDDDDKEVSTMAQHHGTPTGRRLSLAAIGMALSMSTAAAPAAAQGTTFVGCPTWTADGGELIYCSGTDAYSEIFEVTPAGDVRQLTFVGGQASSPEVSPDGSLVVFQASHWDGDPQVYAISREGKRARTVVVGSAVIDIPGERAIKLTSHGSNYDPTFQPTGDRIDFTSDRSGGPTLWSMNVDGSDQVEMHLASATD
jgi:Tol biopolymer transport system component